MKTQIEPSNRGLQKDRSRFYQGIHRFKAHVYINRDGVTAVLVPQDRLAKDRHAGPDRPRSVALELDDVVSAEKKRDDRAYIVLMYSSSLFTWHQQRFHQILHRSGQNN
jgi:hypothetical protein